MLLTPSSPGEFCVSALSLLPLLPLPILLAFVLLRPAFVSFVLVVVSPACAVASGVLPLVVSLGPLAPLSPECEERLTRAAWRG